MFFLSHGGYGGACLFLLQAFQEVVSGVGLKIVRAFLPEKVMCRHENKSTAVANKSDG